MEFQKNFVTIILLISAVFLAGCSAQEQQTGDYTDQITTEDGRESPLLTGNVVATVGEDEITAEQVAEIQDFFMQQGQQISEEDALEQLINQKVLANQAKEEGYSLTDKEAESTIETQLAVQNVSLEEYKQMLESQGIAYEEYLQDIKKDLIIEEYVDSKLEEKTYNVSEEEAREFYQMFKSQSEEEVPAYEEVEEQIITGLVQEKEHEELGNLVMSLRETLEINYK